MTVAAATKDRLGGTDIPRAHTHNTACITSALSLHVLDEHVHLISWVNSKHHAHITMRGGRILPTEKPLRLK